jgi:hypothetical protein
MPAFRDLTGLTFGHLTAIRRVANNKTKVRWLWRCQCGVEREADAYQVTAERRISCGCQSPNRLIDRTGQHFGRWVVLKPSSGRRGYSLCRCECGTERDVYDANLKNGTSKGCGCIDMSGDNNPMRRAVKKKHGENYVQKGTPWYRQAAGIFARCRAGSIEIGFESICELATYLIQIAPERCPVFDVPFSRGEAGFSPFAPSADRKDNSKGYVRGNIQIMSFKANSMKANASAEEMKLFADWAARQNQNPYDNAGWSAGLT